MIYITPGQRVRGKRPGPAGFGIVLGTVQAVDLPDPRLVLIRWDGEGRDVIEFLGAIEPAADTAIQDILPRQYTWQGRKVTYVELAQLYRDECSGRQPGVPVVRPEVGIEECPDIGE